MERSVGGSVQLILVKIGVDVIMLYVDVYCITGQDRKYRPRPRLWWRRWKWMKFQIKTRTKSALWTFNFNRGPHNLTISTMDLSTPISESQNWSSALQRCRKRCPVNPEMGIKTGLSLVIHAIRFFFIKTNHTEGYSHNDLLTQSSELSLCIVKRSAHTRVGADVEIRRQKQTVGAEISRNHGLWFSWVILWSA